MEYFKINGIDFSQYVKGLKVSKSAVYNTQTNAAGNSVVDYINSKRTIEVSIIPLNEVDLLRLMTAITNIGVSISYRNPHTNLLEEDVSCLIPDNEIEFYTIQINKVMYKELKLKFTEL